MNPKRLLLAIWLLMGFLSLFSQNGLEKKYEFVYKTVGEHNIMATIYLPDSGDKLPVLIYFHGGGFIFGNRDQGLENILKDKLLANKIAIVSADYRLAPETRLEDMMEDVSDIVSWIRKNGQDKFGIDTGKIAVAGGSSGGYLALSSGFDTTSAPDAIITISSPMGFSTAGIKTGDLSLLENIQKDTIVSYGDYTTRMDLWRYLGRNGLALYTIFGFDPVKEPQKLDQYTLTNNIKSGYPPTLIIHSKNDRMVNIKDAELFYSFLQEKNVETELFIVENGHSSDLIDKHPEAIDEVVLFLKKVFDRNDN